MGRSVARIGDSVAVFRPPGFTYQGFVDGATGTPPTTTPVAGFPVTGTVTIPLNILGCIQRGSSKLRLGGLGAAHIADPVMVPMPPTFSVAGADLVGILTIAVPLQGTIEIGSSTIRSESRGLAHVGDSVMIFFPPNLPCPGTLGGQPFAGTLTIISPVRGIIQGGMKSVAFA